MHVEPDNRGNLAVSKAFVSQTASDCPPVPASAHALRVPDTIVEFVASFRSSGNKALSDNRVRFRGEKPNIHMRSST